MDEYSTCCFCGCLCTVHSQACGSCMRLNTFKHPSDISYFTESDDQLNGSVDYNEDTISIVVISNNSECINSEHEDSECINSNRVSKSILEDIESDHEDN